MQPGMQQPGMQQPGMQPGMPGMQQPGMPGMQPGMPGMPGMQQPGMPGMQQPVHNPYGQAQSALKGAGTTMKMMQYGFAGLGVVLLVLGLVMMITYSFSTGMTLIITGVVLAATAFFFLPQFTSMVGSATSQVDALAAKSELAQTGMPAVGRLMSVQQTGVMVNYNPEILATVEVQHPQMGVYQVQTKAVVPQIAIPQFQPGAQVQVRINPMNPQDIALVT
jgi:hypothetical protein